MRNKKIKVISKDAIVILCHGIAISCHNTAIPWHNITIPCFNMNNESGNDKLFNLIANTFLPVRWQKIAGKKWQIFLLRAEAIVRGGDFC